VAVGDAGRSSPIRLRAPTVRLVKTLHTAYRVTDLAVSLAFYPRSATRRWDGLASAAGRKLGGMLGPRARDQLHGRMIQPRPVKRYAPTMGCRTRVGVAASVLGVLPAALLTAAGAAPHTGRIVGHVRECNTPTHCIVQPFKVSARNAAGVMVAHTTTTGNNYFALRVPRGRVALVARSAGGLTCRGSATAIAGKTVHTTITCLVP
jgi:hypothetical protein